MTDEQPRWRYRFDNYKRAFLLIREAMETLEKRELTQLEKEGVIQRFECTWELAWKVMKDYLEYSGIILETTTPRAVIRAALAASIIEDGEGWMKALDVRNRIAHTYNFKTFELAIKGIQTEYLILFDQLHLFLMEKANLNLTFSR